MAKLIAIEHEGIEAGPDGPAKVSEKAFKLIWEPKGWTKVEGSEEEPPELVLPDGSLDQQIRKAQQALEEGRLTPPAEGDAPVVEGGTPPVEDGTPAPAPAPTTPKKAAAKPAAGQEG